MQIRSLYALTANKHNSQGLTRIKYFTTLRVQSAVLVLKVLSQIKAGLVVLTPPSDHKVFGLNPTVHQYISSIRNIENSKGKHR